MRYLISLGLLLSSCTTINLGSEAYANALKVRLIKCEYIEDKYVGCKADLGWCAYGSCLLSKLECDISKTGNIWLPKNCFK